MTEPFAGTNMNHDLDLLLEWLDSDGRRLWAAAVRRLRVELNDAKRARDVYDWRWRSLEALAAQHPPCPGCGMTAQVEQSRSEPGRWMCHGCARTFDAQQAANSHA